MQPANAARRVAWHHSAGPGLARHGRAGKGRGERARRAERGRYGFGGICSCRGATGPASGGGDTQGSGASFGYSSPAGVAAQGELDIDRPDRVRGWDFASQLVRRPNRNPSTGRHQPQVPPRPSFKANRSTKYSLHGALLRHVSTMSPLRDHARASTSLLVCSSMPAVMSEAKMSSSAATYSAGLMFMPRCALFMSRPL